MKTKTLSDPSQISDTGILRFSDFSQMALRLPVGSFR